MTYKLSVVSLILIVTIGMTGCGSKRLDSSIQLEPAWIEESTIEYCKVTETPEGVESNCPVYLRTDLAECQAQNSGLEFRNNNTDTLVETDIDMSSIWSLIKLW